MSATRLKTAYKKAVLDEGGWIFVRTCNVSLAGDPDPLDVRFAKLSETKKKKFFPDQKTKIISKCPLKEMDVSLLDKIIIIFGNLPAGGILESYLNDLKNLRNEFIHDELQDQSFTFTKTILKTRLNDLKTLYRNILQELKKHSDPKSIPLLDQDISDVVGRLGYLEKDLDDLLEENATTLSTVTQKASASMTSMKDDAIKASHSMTSVKDDAIQTSHSMTSVKDDAIQTSHSMTSMKYDAIQTSHSMTSMKDDAIQASYSMASMKYDAIHAKKEVGEARSRLKECVEEQASAITEGSKLFKDMINELKDAGMNKESKESNMNLNDQDEEIRKSAKKDNIAYLASMWDILTADWMIDCSDCVTANPSEIFTDIHMLNFRKIKRNSKQTDESISYPCILEIQDENGESYNVIILTGDGGMGKTTFLKYIAEMYGIDPNNIKIKTINGLADFNVALYIECRNVRADSFDDLIKKQFSSTLKKFSMTPETFKDFLRRNKVIILIDGYDEIRSESKEEVRKILEELSDSKVIITTRKGSLARLQRQLGKKSVAIFEILGILKEHREEFVMKLLTKHIDNEEERIQMCSGIMELLNRMATKFGALLQSPMILTHIVKLKLDSPAEIEEITTTTDLFEALIEMKMSKAKLRLENQPGHIEDIDGTIVQFIRIYEETGFKTHANEEFELTEDTNMDEKDKCKEQDLPYEELASNFYDTSISNGKRIYKYHHLTEQEYTVSRYLARCISQAIKKGSTLKGTDSHSCITELENNIIWKYLMGKMSNSELMEIKDQLPQYRNIITFMSGEMPNISLVHKKREKVLEKLGERLVFLGWLCNYEQIFADTLYTTAGSNVSFTKTNQLENEAKKEIESDRLYIPDFEESTSETSNNGREDFALTMLSESKCNTFLNNPLSAKLSKKSHWNITNELNFPALNAIFKSTQPRQISIAIDSDPVLYPERQKTLDIISEKQIELKLYINSQYQCDNKGLSDDWIKEDSKMIDFIGRLSEKGIAKLPSALESLYVAIDPDYLQFLYKKIKTLNHLEILDIKIDVSKVNLSTLPTLPDWDKSLSLCLILPDSGCLISEVIGKLCSTTENKYTKITNLCLKNTDMTSTRVHCLLEDLNKINLTVSGAFIIWTKEDVPDYDVISKKAQQFNLGRVIIYDTRTTAEILPKQIVKKLAAFSSKKIEENVLADTKTLDEISLRVDESVQEASKRLLETVQEKSKRLDETDSLIKRLREAVEMTNKTTEKITEITTSATITSEIAEAVIPEDITVDSSFLK